MSAVSGLPAEAFAAALCDLAEENERICIVINDSTETHHATEFARRFPDRVIDVGIAEQDMVGVAAGLANGGWMPFVHSASCFLTARAMEQIKVDVAYERADVKLCGFVSGLDYGPLGGTHHSLEDLAWMRAIPGMTVLAPGTCLDTAAAARALALRRGPAFVRVISKTEVPEMFPAHHNFAIGHAERLREGSDLTLVGTGVTSTVLVAAAGLLSSAGIEARVLHMGSIAPLDADAVVAAASETEGLVVVEEHVSSGGLAGSIAEVLCTRSPAWMLSIGVPNEFAPIGPTAWLRSHFGLTAEGVAARTAKWLADRSKVAVR